MKIIINGEFLCNNVSGIERVAREITQRLDEISMKDEIGIVISNNAKNVPAYKNLTVIRYEKDIVSFPKWQQFILPGLLRKYKAMPLDFGNSCSLFYPGISFLHDIYYELYPEDFKTKREKYERLYFRILYRIIAYRAKKIVTVSEYSKAEIVSAFSIDPSRISVVYNSADHVKSIKADDSVFQRFPALLDAPFYFSLGSHSKRKNLRWIFEHAAVNPDSLFAISGSSLITRKEQEAQEREQPLPPNVIMLGRLEDGEAKALMQRCRAFILPSYYEGFGITPLEALACGAKVIVAKAASLPEIYGRTARYIDPFNFDVNLGELLTQPAEPPDEILAKYSYDKAAQQVYALVKGFA
ncbi:MAG: glycosyltransferase family 4 protein [Spirochaetes bacterium]|nr:glycosyltransferase family 4 protein [Spirochaetota bacterium]